MRIKGIAITIFITLLVEATAVSICFADASSNFYQVNHEVYDDWNVCRTSAMGENGFLQLTEKGFRPVITFESLGSYNATAYRLGQEFADRYPDPKQRAEQIFYFVRDRVRYMPDGDQFGFSEFAQNADELADNVTVDGVASGDCEDSAVLLAVMYQGAGYRSAIVLAPEHAATIVYLPDYEKANTVLTLNGEQGWVWAEATGRNNPFGWFPEQYATAELVAYEISAEPISVAEPPSGAEPAAARSGTNPFMLSMPLFIVIGLMLLLRLMRRH
jgi:hypothetical protein